MFSFILKNKIILLIIFLLIFSLGCSQLEKEKKLSEVSIYGSVHHRFNRTSMTYEECLESKNKFTSFKLYLNYANWSNIGCKTIDNYVESLVITLNYNNISINHSDLKLGVLSKEPCRLFGSSYETSGCYNNATFYVHYKNGSLYKKVNIFTKLI